MAPSSSSAIGTNSSSSSSKKPPASSSSSKKKGAPPQQSSLDSFFGAAPTNPKVRSNDTRRPKTIQSFFGHKQQQQQQQQQQQPNKKEKENDHGKTTPDQQERSAAASPGSVITTTNSSKNSISSSKRKVPEDDAESSRSSPMRTQKLSPPRAQKIVKRRVIEDDDDDDDSSSGSSNEEEEEEEDSQTKTTLTEPVNVVMPDASADANAVPEHPPQTLAAESGSKVLPAVNKRAPMQRINVESDSVAVQKFTNRKLKATAGVASKLGKTAMEDESDSDAAESIVPEEMDEVSVSSLDGAKKKPSTTLSTKTKKPKSTTSNSKKSASGSSKEYKSDDAILQEIDSSLGWDTDMPYLLLCRALAQCEAVTSRLAIQEIFTTLFRQIMLHSSSNSRRDDLRTVLYLASNTVAAAYECVELGIGDSILIKAIGQATGTRDAMVKEKYESVGDLGTVAQTLKSKQRTLGSFFGSTATTKKKPPLSATTVWKTFRQIAETKGGSSQKLKIDLVQSLLVRATDPVETKYIVRGLQGKLRVGLSGTTVIISLAHALALTVPPSVRDMEEKEAPNNQNVIYPEEAKQYMDKKQPIEKRMEAAVAIVKRAYSEVPSYEAILEAAVKVPLQKFHLECTLKPGIPVSPMLAKPTKSVQEVLKRLNGLDFTVEYKYDGERAQVHLLPDGTAKVFSRNLLDTSEKYPEVPDFVKEASKNVDSFVLDAEVVAYNRETERLVPFQILSTRKRTEESAETAKVQVIVQAFDLMYLNGKSLLDRTLAERRALLREHFVPVEGKFAFATSMDHKENGDTTLLEEFLEAAVKGQCEGLMIKTLEVNAIYEPSRRSLNWLKLKKDYQEGLGDSVDLVPIGAYHGRGKRTGVYGAYLLACFDPEREEFQSVCKIGTGFSDEDLKTLSDNLNKHKIASKSRQYNTSDQLECDVWFDAVEVWEIKAADLSKSSVHRGADGMTGETGRGIGLRFPRFERLRTDKGPTDATTSHQIWDMYLQQDNIAGGGDTNMYDDDDEGI